MAAYDVPAWWYDLRGVLWVLPWSYRSGLFHQVGFFAANVAETHLEVAGGSGALLKWVLRWRRPFRPRQVVVVDQSMRMVATLRARFLAWPNVHVRKADASWLPFPDASFASVNCANALHVFPDIDAALAEIYRVLKPGGRFAANVLLHPRGRGQRLARWVNRWGQRTGILHTPYHQADIQRRLTDTGFLRVHDAVHGNSYDVVAQKP